MNWITAWLEIVVYVTIKYLKLEDFMIAYIVAYI